jgi:3-phenylpropionate/trans-cinnamate dioxygenase ferredoxin reductase component
VSVVVIGNGVAGATVAATLRTKGYDGPVWLIGDEPHPPYQRPPLSKDQLKDGGDPPLLRPQSYWAEKDIELVMGVRAGAIDRGARRVHLADGREIAYEHLVLATGSRNREIPGAQEALSLRTLDESRALRERLMVPGTRLVVVGGGFIGLEVAAAVRTLGAEVTVVEALDRVMARVVSEPMSRWFEARHGDAGVRVLLERRVEAITGDGVTLDDGETLGAEAVLVAVGVIPNTELAQAAGLTVDDGIVVDEHLATGDPAISALGDCARFPGPHGHHRLESVQNATDQARAVVARILGRPAPYDAVPWVWTDQLGHKLQIAGVAPQGAEAVRRGEPAPDGGFSIGLFSDGQLVAVESIDRTADHLAARKLVASGSITSQQFADTQTPLKNLTAAAAAK